MSPLSDAQHEQIEKLDTSFGRSEAGLCYDPVTTGSVPSRNLYGAGIHLRACHSRH